VDAPPEADSAALRRFIQVDAATGAGFVVLVILIYVVVLPNAWFIVILGGLLAVEVTLARGPDRAALGQPALRATNSSRSAGVSKPMTTQACASPARRRASTRWLPSSRTSSPSS
jgi:hypothetical protein